MILREGSRQGLNLYFQVLLLELRGAMAYRFDFWMRVLTTLVSQVLVAYFLWNAIYSFRGVDEIGGYSFAAMMFYNVLYSLVASSNRGPDLGHISLEIYQGRLTKFLVFPVSFFLYKWASYLASSLLFIAQIAIFYFCYYFFVEAEIAGLGLAPFLMGIVACVAAAYLYFSIAACLEMCAFWTDHTWSLMVMFRIACGFLGGGLIPLALFPDHWRAVLEMLPFASLLSFPIVSFMGGYNFSEWLGNFCFLLFWCALFNQIACIVFNRGSREYSGVGI